MSVAKNAAKDLVGEAEQVTGAALHKKDLEEKGHEKRVEAVQDEEVEEAKDGRQHKDFEEEKVKDGGMGVPDYNKSTSISVDEVTSDGDKSGND
jgi:hypothetical protein